jgi:hypothetical protein
MSTVKKSIAYVAGDKYVYIPAYWYVIGRYSTPSIFNFIEEEK